MKEKNILKISILIPVFNVEQCLQTCIDSILKQNAKNVEIVLVDDGSTDNSGDICDEYFKRNSNVIKVFHKKNEGLISARRLGIREASGDVAVFLDSDDELLPNSIDNIRSYFAEDDELELLMFLWKRNNNGKITYREEIFPNKTIVSSDKTQVYKLLLKSTKLNSLCLKSIRLNLLKKDDLDYKQYYSISHAEDLLQSLYPLTNAKKIMFVNDIFYEYKYRFSSITNEKFKISDLSLSNNLLDFLILEYIKKWDINEQEAKKMFYLKKLNTFLNKIVDYIGKMENNKKKFEIINSKIEKEFSTNKGYKRYIYNNDFTIFKKFCLILIYFKVVKVIWLMKKIKTYFKN